MRCAKRWLIFAFCVMFYAQPALATEYSSTSYKVLDPIVTDGAAGEMTSTSYRLRGTVGELVSGRTTATSFTVRAGSLAFPTATAPVLSASSVAGGAFLSWTASSGSLGWTISGYDVCTGTASNTYTCENAGNVLSFTKTGLTAGTTYYFRVRGRDAFGNAVVRSSEVTATPTVSTAGGGSAVVSGGGGGGALTGPTFPTATITPVPSAPSATALPAVSAPTAVAVESETVSTATVILKGRAYPGVAVSFLRNGALVKKVTANAQAEFSGAIPELKSGVHTFGVQAFDKNGRKSILLTYTLNIPQGIKEIAVDGIFLPPTMDLSAETIARGETLNIFGQSFPGSAITVRVNSPVEIAATVLADKVGAWLYRFNTAPLEEGAHLTRARARSGKDESTFGEAHSFIVGHAKTLAQAKCKIADLNLDGRVNTTDVSILLAFWEIRAPENPCADISRDGAVGLPDLSIMLYHWTG